MAASAMHLLPASVMNLIVLALIFLLPPCILAAPHAHLVSALPGQPPVSFNQYSGYISLDQHKTGQAFFYYFVEAESDPSSQPLVLWLNGGPGCSSVGIGAFTENGPFLASKTGLIRNDYGWNKVANVLYVDSPIGVGWSYSNNTKDYRGQDDNTTALYNIAFLINWFGAFPEYKTADFFITGESYAGHYAPQLAKKVLEYNANGRGVFKINFKGIAIGNPLLLGLVTERYFFYFTHGLISDESYNGITRTCNFSKRTHESLESRGCGDYIVQAGSEVGRYINHYDVLLDLCVASGVKQQLRLESMMGIKSESVGPDVCIGYEISDYLNTPEVQGALHANTTGLNYSWGECANNSFHYNRENLGDDMIPTLSHLIDAGLRVLVYSGDQDSVVPFIGTRNGIYELAKAKKLAVTVPYSAWFQGQQVAGWTEAYGNLTYLTVRGAAHMVPYSNPARALALIHSFLEGKPMPGSPSSS